MSARREAIRSADARERVLAGGNARGVRRPVVESWRRAGRSGVDPERGLPPVPLTEDHVAEQRRRHPLAAAWPAVADALRGALTEPGHIVFAADERGHLLWVDGDRGLRRRAEDVHLVAGALWSEDAAGTCGVGTALALGRPFRVVAGEHYLQVATSFTCAAAPVHDPAGRRLGVIDVTSPAGVARDDTLGVVTLAARLAETTLRERARRHALRLAARYGNRLSLRAGIRNALVGANGDVLWRHPDGWLPLHLGVAPREGELVLPDGQPVTVERLGPNGPFLVIGRGTAGTGVRFAGLGRERAWLAIDGVGHDLSRRHGELVALLLASPAGLSAQALARAVHGQRGRPGTVRAELARLRPLLGHRLAADPYRLAGAADFAELDELELPEALERYRGPLLPGSRAPGVVALREAVHERLDARVRAAGDPGVQRRWQALCNVIAAGARA